jgi:hypothetical protein
MPFDPGKIPVELIDAARQRTLVPLIGAGVSRQAKHRFPTWGELMRLLIEHALSNKPPSINKFEAKDMRRLLEMNQFLMVAEELRSRLEDQDYLNFLIKTFLPKDVEPAEVHKALFRLNPPLILTTNYDLLLEDAHAAEFGKAATVYTYLGAESVQKALIENSDQDRSIIFKIHGSIHLPSEIIFTERDYRHLTFDQLGYRALISAIFTMKTVLMLGFSFTDRELQVLLEALRHSFRYRSSLDYIFLPAKEAGIVETHRLKEDYGVEVITCDKHSELLDLINFLIRQSAPKRAPRKSSAKKPKKRKP